MKNLFEQDYFEQRAKNIKKRKLMYLEEVSRLKSYIKTGTILDFGAGTGEFAEIVGSRNSYYCFDISNHAKTTLRQKGFSVIDFLTSDHIDFFNTIILRGVLQSLPNPFQELLSLSKYLKRGGHLIFLATPNCNNLTFFINQANPMIDMSKSFLYPLDIEIINFLERNGFVLVSKHYPYFKSPYWSLWDLLNIVPPRFKKSQVRASWRGSMELYFEKR